MAENILPWLPLLTEKQRQELEPCGVHRLSNRRRAIETVLEASREYRAAYAIIADKLQGPRYTAPADQSD